MIECVVEPTNKYIVFYLHEKNDETKESWYLYQESIHAYPSEMQDKATLMTRYYNGTLHYEEPLPKWFVAA